MRHEPVRSVSASQSPLLVRNLRIRYDEHVTHRPDGATLEVRRGEVVLLLGPSGCGKSTLALALNGLVPHAIAADVDGQVITGGLVTTEATVPQLSERVAMVFQDPDAQIVTATVFDEVCFGPENLLLPVDEILRRAEAALRAVGLWERRADNPATLSGGGRQRLAIACALAMGSDLVVLDEPTANLDPAGIEEVYRALREVVSAGERSILLIEHNLDAAIDLVDRVVVLDGDGRTALAGTPREVLVDRAAEVLALGVWLPVATLAGLRLRDAGFPLSSVPLTPAELTAAIDGIPSLPAPPATLAEQPPSADRADAVPSVRVRDLTIRRGGTVIVEGIDLDVGAGDFLAVVGTNGAGKTTLTQAIAGVVAPPKGRVSVGDLDPATSDARALARHVGFVFQNPEHQFIAPTVHDELAHGLRLRDAPSGVTPDQRDAWIESRVDAMLTRFGLSALRDAHPFLLSGGQKRRLSVGTALIAGAPVLVLDEPTFGQDRERAEELLALLAELHLAGTTVIVVTHDLQLVAEYATHVAVLAAGRLIRTGRTSDVLADGDLLELAGLRPPPLARAMRGLTRHPDWRWISRLRDLPGGAG